MKPYHIALKNLSRRPARMFFLTVALAVGLAAVVVLVVALVSLLAAWYQTWRAGKMDPADALRSL